MNSKQRMGLAIGGGVLAVGAAVGVGAMAANLAGSDIAAPGAPGYGPGRGDRTGQPQRLDTTQMASALASKLGVDEATVRTALDNALQAARPSDGNRRAPSGAPSGDPGGFAPRTNMLTAMASSIAAELHLDQSTVLTALQQVWADYGPAANRPSGQPTS